MCGHLFKQINDVSVCLKCGLTIAEHKIFFDKKLLNRKEKKKYAKKK